MRRPLPRYLGDDRLTARYIKVHPHEMMPEYEVSIWVDSSYSVCAYAHRVESLLDDHPMALFSHPDRYCVFDELDVVQRLRLDEDRAVERMRRFLESRGVPLKAGLSASGILTRRHHDPRVARQ